MLTSEVIALYMFYQEKNKAFAVLCKAIGCAWTRQGYMDVHSLKK